MGDELKFPDPSARADRDSLAEPLKSLVREAYTPPFGESGPDAYWAGLERTIMARVRTEGAGEVRWWTELAPWARVGLVAATAIFALAGVINQRMADPDEQAAYELVTQPDLSAASDEPIAAQYGTADTDAATLRYYLSN